MPLREGRRTSGALRAVLCTLVVAGALGAMPAGAAEAARPAAASQALTAASEPAALPAPVTAYHLAPTEEARAVAYATARHWLYLIDTLGGILLLLALLRLRVAVRLRAVAERISRRKLVQALIFTPLFGLTLAAAGLPTEMWGERLSREYGQSVQGWGSWFGDWAKGQLLGLGLASVVVWVLYGLLRRSPRRWWLYSWLLSIPATVFLLFVAPRVIEPLFFEFEPLQATRPELARELESVALRAGLSIPPDRILEMKASAKTRSINAYVDGFGPSQRVVVWDTSLAAATTPQILFIFGHELGHYVLGHIYRGIAFALAGLLLGLFLADRTARWALGRFGAGLGIRDAGDLASLPVLLLVFALLGLLGTPVGNAFSRRQEHEADVYGLEVIHGIVPDPGQAAASAFQLLGAVDLDEPHPNRLIELWLYSHPSIAERIRFASAYDPWQPGQAPRFVR